MNTYNGWTNRETWLVNIWFMDSFDGERVTAEFIEELVTDYVDEQIPAASFISDLIDINCINWAQLASDHNEDMAIQAGSASRD